jgi:hypothetical protein
VEVAISELCRQSNTGKEMSEKWDLKILMNWRGHNMSGSSRWDDLGAMKNIIGAEV